MAVDPTTVSISNPASHQATDSAQRDLLQRLQAAAADQTIDPIDGAEVLPIEDELDPGEAMDRFVRKWFADEFMRTMLFEDEEKTGIKPEEWS